MYLYTLYTVCMYACTHSTQFEAHTMPWPPYNFKWRDMPWPPPAWLAPEARAVPLLSLRWRWPPMEADPQYVGHVSWKVPDPDLWRWRCGCVQCMHTSSRLLNCISLVFVSHQYSIKMQVHMLHIPIQKLIWVYERLIAKCWYEWDACTYQPSS